VRAHGRCIDGPARRKICTHVPSDRLPLLEKQDALAAASTGHQEISNNLKNQVAAMVFETNQGE
jgi:hypothetical protein